MGSLTVKTYTHPEEYVVAEVMLRGEWGEAGVGLDIPEARALARRLLDADDEAEARRNG